MSCRASALTVDHPLNNVRRRRAPPGLRALSTWPRCRRCAAVQGRDRGSLTHPGFTVSPRADTRRDFRFDVGPPFGPHSCCKRCWRHTPDASTFHINRRYGRQGGTAVSYSVMYSCRGCAFGLDIRAFSCAVVTTRAAAAKSRCACSPAARAVGAGFAGPYTPYRTRRQSAGAHVERMRYTAVTDSLPSTERRASDCNDSAMPGHRRGRCDRVVGAPCEYLARRLRGRATGYPAERLPNSRVRIAGRTARCITIDVHAADQLLNAILALTAARHFTARPYSSSRANHRLAIEQFLRCALPRGAVPGVPGPAHRGHAMLSAASFSRARREHAGVGRWQVLAGGRIWISGNARCGPLSCPRASRTMRGWRGSAGIDGAQTGIACAPARSATADPVAGSIHAWTASCIHRITAEAFYSTPLCDRQRHGSAYVQVCSRCTQPFRKGAKHHSAGLRLASTTRRRARRELSRSTRRTLSAVWRASMRKHFEWIARCIRIVRTPLEALERAAQAAHAAVKWLPAAQGMDGRPRCDRITKHCARLKLPAAPRMPGQNTGGYRRAMQDYGNPLRLRRAARPRCA